MSTGFDLAKWFVMVDGEYFSTKYDALQFST